MYGVTIGDKHSQRDWGMVLVDRVIAPPAPKINRVDVPMRDGSIDLTESLTGEVKYEDRIITLTFSIVDPIKKWSSMVSEIENYVHGKRMKIIFDDDLSFYYLGRISVDEWSSKKTIGKLVIRCTTEPYKYDINSSADPWEWDTFDFETGIINELYDLKVEGELEVTIIGNRKRVYPNISANAMMELEYNGEKFILFPGGVFMAFEIIIGEGPHVLKFIGNGRVTIDYRGGSL